MCAFIRVLYCIVKTFFEWNGIFVSFEISVTFEAVFAISQAANVAPLRWYRVQISFWDIVYRPTCTVNKDWMWSKRIRFYYFILGLNSLFPGMAPLDGRMLQLDISFQYSLHVNVDRRYVPLNLAYFYWQSFLGLQWYCSKTAWAVFFQDLVQLAPVTLRCHIHIHAYFNPLLFLLYELLINCYPSSLTGNHYWSTC